MTGKMSSFQVKEKCEYNPCFNYYDNHLPHEISEEINKIKDKALKLSLSFIDGKSILEFIHEFGEETIVNSFKNLSKINRYNDLKDDLEKHQTDKDHILGILYLYGALLGRKEDELSKINLNINKVYLMIILHNIGTDYEEHKLERFYKEHFLNIAEENIEKYNECIKDENKIKYLKNINKTYIENRNNFEVPETSLVKILNDLEKFLYLLYNYKNLNIKNAKKSFIKLIDFKNTFKEKFGISIFLGLDKVYQNLNNINTIEDFKNEINSKTDVWGVQFINIKK